MATLWVRNRQQQQHAWWRTMNPYQEVRTETHVMVTLAVRSTITNCHSWQTTPPRQPSHTFLSTQNACLAYPCTTRHTANPFKPRMLELQECSASHHTRCTNSSWSHIGPRTPNCSCVLILKKEQTGQTQACVGFSAFTCTCEGTLASHIPSKCHFHCSS